MNYKTIFIDWHGTLSHSRFWDTWNDTPEHYEKYEAIQNALFRSDEGRKVVHDWMRGLRSVHNVLSYVNEVSGLETGVLEDGLRSSCESMKLSDPSVIDQVQRLRARGVKMVIATDNMDVFRLWTVKALQLDQLFDGILTSDTAGALKTDFNPDGSSPFFGQYMRQNNLKSRESVIIDNSEDALRLNTIGIDFLYVNQSKSLRDHLDDILGTYETK